MLKQTTRVGELLADHFGEDPTPLPVVTELFEPWDHVNVQAAFDEYLAGKAHTEIGATIPPPPGGSVLPPDPPKLATLLTAADVRVGAGDRIDLPDSHGTQMPCINQGLVLVDTDAGKLAVWFRPDSLLHGRKLAVDVKAPSVEAAHAFFEELNRLKVVHNRFRGRMVRFNADIYGNIHVNFDERPSVTREDVILSPGVLESIERHVIGIAEAADDLKAAGRHLKRGVLLYGPPGTGKTLTIKYLSSRLPDATMFSLTGTAMGWLRFVSELAADLAPSVIVLDDVDLIAEDRRLGGMSPRRHLFDLLDAMDGVHDDADVLFVCTTNRPESLEKAIAARPGRVDQAVAITPPDAGCRRRLFELYSKGLDLKVTDVDAIVERTEGVTGSFFKELLRRAAVIALGRDGTGTEITVTDRDVNDAIDVLLDPSNPLAPSLRTGGQA